jgi:hypothetical protein
VVGYVGRFAPAAAVSLASSKGGEPATEFTSSRSNTTNGDASTDEGSRKRTRFDWCMRGSTILLAETRDPAEP